MFYYFNDGKKFTSKIEAIKYGLDKSLSPRFYYHDHVYEKLDWTVEPPLSLDYYYKEYAQYIRDNYDYVILAYSGGYDSTNILETFHFNGIKLDKIITVGALSQDTKNLDDHNHNGELYYNVFPYIKELGLESILQVIDYTNLFENIDNFSISSHNENWVHEIGAWYSPHNWFWRDIEKYIVPKEWKDKRVALVFGKDKPVLVYNPESYIINDRMKLNSFRFSDTPCMSYADTGQIENITRINFYWNTTHNNILLKQLHTLKRVYDIKCMNSYDHTTSTQTLNGMNINKIVYNLKKPLLYKSPKSKDNLLSLRDSYLKDKTNSDVFSLYRSGIERISREVGIEKIIPISSRFYNLC